MDCVALPFNRSQALFTEEQMQMIPEPLSLLALSWELRKVVPVKGLTQGST